MKPSVLVVDDEPFIVTGLRVFLEDEGMRVDSVDSGERALEVAGTDCGYDVCIMDMRLPGMNGNSTIRALHELCPQLKFVIHTGSANYTIPDDLRAIGIVEKQVFAKPLLDMTPLAETVQALAGGVH
jgi:CheY-like chemotaxis protein